MRETRTRYTDKGERARRWLHSSPEDRIEDMSPRSASPHCSEVSGKCFWRKVSVNW
jgi:hypothetical protein